MRLSFSSSSSSFWSAPSSCPLEHLEWSILEDPKVYCWTVRKWVDPVIFYCLNRLGGAILRYTHMMGMIINTGAMIACWHIIWRRQDQPRKKNARAWRAIVARWGGPTSYSLGVCPLCVAWIFLSYLLPSHFIKNLSLGTCIFSYFLRETPPGNTRGFLGITLPQLISHRLLILGLTRTSSNRCPALDQQWGWFYKSRPPTKGQHHRRK